MNLIYALDDKHLEYAADNGEFSSEIIESSPLVAVILTQSWCPQWLFMKNNLKKLAKMNEEGEQVPRVFFAEYDRSSLFDRFRTFKEEIFGNDFVPYVRYYRDGCFIGSSNYVSLPGFLACFSD
jgi:hypothetical protein